MYKEKGDAQRLLSELKPMFDPIYQILGTKSKHDYHVPCLLESKKEDLEAYRGDEPMDNFMSHFKLMYNLKNFDILETLDTDPDSPALIEQLKENVNLEEWALHHKALKDHLYTVPKWVEMDSVNRGKVFHWKHYPFIALSMIYVSLHMNYTQPRINETLVKTGYLVGKKVVLRRLVETTRFVLECMLSEDSLAINSVGWKGIAKVRCLHSTVRTRLAARNESELKDVFVNQSEMCFTLTTFAFHSLLGVARLGIHFSKQDIEDYFHLWRYIGFLLGVREDINPLALPVQVVMEQVLSTYSTFEMKDASPRLSRALNECLPYSSELSMAFAHHLNPKIVYEGFELDPVSTRTTIKMYIILFILRLIHLPVFLIISVYPSFAYSFGNFTHRMTKKYYLKEDTEYNPVTIAKAGGDATCPVTGKAMEGPNCPITGQSGECAARDVVINVEEIRIPEKVLEKQSK
ncbi:hypothetical protein HDV01_000337 [Terramyces sp. JEL0728]|nr:hypothetical protein HDV01_000337 [Terramyces sp. JEL0728]